MKPGDLVEPDWSFRAHAKPGDTAIARQIGLVLSHPEVKHLAKSASDNMIEVRKTVLGVTTSQLGLTRKRQVVAHKN